jgi:hypothetical protein
LQPLWWSPQRASPDGRGCWSSTSPTIGFKELLQHRRHFVAADTHWWPPFCLVVDWVAAAILVAPISVVGVDFHH